jgi:hypothetical protein
VRQRVQAVSPATGAAGHGGARHGSRTSLIICVILLFVLSILLFVLSIVPAKRGAECLWVHVHSSGRCDEIVLRWGASCSCMAVSGRRGRRPGPRLVVARKTRADGLAATNCAAHWGVNSWLVVKGYGWTYPYKGASVAATRPDLGRWPMVRRKAVSSATRLCGASRRRT